MRNTAARANWSAPLPEVGCDRPVSLSLENKKNKIRPAHNKSAAIDRRAKRSALSHLPLDARRRTFRLLRRQYFRPSDSAGICHRRQLLALFLFVRGRATIKKLAIAIRGTISHRMSIRDSRPCARALQKGAKRTTDENDHSATVDSWLTGWSVGWLVQSMSRYRGRKIRPPGAR